MPLLHCSVTEPADTPAFPVTGASFAACCAVSDLSHSCAIHPHTLPLPDHVQTVA